MLNKGEWGEFYVLLHLLETGEFKFVDYNLNEIKNTKYRFFIKNITTKGRKELTYTKNGNKVDIYSEGIKLKGIDLKRVIDAKKELLEELTTKKSPNPLGLPTFKDFYNSFAGDIVLKGSSSSKEDFSITIERFDNNTKLTNIETHEYSVKSEFGRPATLLNASKATNLKYKISNFNRKNMYEVNSINGEKKLMNRLRKILELGGDISFYKITSPEFDYTVNRIDPNLRKVIADALIESYSTENNKEIRKIFSEYPPKVIIAFMYAAIFGFMPSTRWDGSYIVNGGIIIARKDGDVVLLDNIYYMKEIIKYLFKNSKFDSPSSSRYHMLEISEENNEFYFTLNLQIRFIGDDDKNLDDELINHLDSMVIT